MSLIFNPNYLNDSQQIQQNKNDIAELKNEVFYLYTTKLVLERTTTGVPLVSTDIGDQSIQNSYLSDINGLIFKIESLSESGDTVFITFAFDIKGPQGIQGPQGPQGVQGIQGETGRTGPQGAKGDKGDRGLQGIQGAQGIQGVEGPQGETGPQGVQGIQGEKGEQGETGPTGPAGPQGIQGIQGVKGDKGDNGNSFIVTGSVNSVTDLPDATSVSLGTAYFVGATYPRNVYAVVNYQGTQIWQNEGTLQGPQGPQGEQGIQGIAGATGPQGEVGPQGPQGEQGIQGPQGIAGPTGPQGPQGLQGPQGPQGEAGEGFNEMGMWVADNEYFKNDIVSYETSDGMRSAYVLISESLSGSTTPPPEDTLNWNIFVSGIQGPQGETGPQGVQGPQGIQGIQGIAGPTGPVGPQGPQGETGPQGPAVPLSTNISSSSTNETAPTSLTTFNFVKSLIGDYAPFFDELYGYKDFYYTTPTGEISPNKIRLQFGHINASGTQYCTLPVPYSDNYYSVFFGAENNTTDSVVMRFMSSFNKTTTEFQIGSTNKTFYRVWFSIGIIYGS